MTVGYEESSMPDIVSPVRSRAEDGRVLVRLVGGIK